MHYQKAWRPQSVGTGTLARRTGIIPCTGRTEYALARSGINEEKGVAYLERCMDTRYSVSFVKFRPGDGASDTFCGILGTPDGIDY